MFSLAGRRALVTGASSGIGKAMAGFLAKAGAEVVLVARREAELLATADELPAESAVHCHVADLVNLDGIESVADAVRTDVGDIQIVVNAAGVNLRQPVDEVTTASWQQTLDLNLAAPFFLARAFIAGMRRAGYGRIINIASLQSERAFPNGLPYGASKGGVAQLTRAMAETWSPDGICCNAIAPGFFPTELTAPVFSNPDTEQWAASGTAMGRNGVMADLEGPTLFFASEASRYVTGQVLYVDGGFTAR